MPSQTEKGLAFRALHERAGAFMIPNPWDAGTARLLAHLGFEALATTSSGHAFSAGQRDNTLARPEVMKYLSVMAAATDLPVSADLVNGFGDTPEVIAETFRLAGATGIVGGSIEDASGNADDPIYEEELATERVRAAAAVVHALPFAFTLTGRAENYLHGRCDLKATIKRLQAYQEAGADVLYAPGLTSKEEIAAVVSSVDRPVNVLAGLQGVPLDLAALSELGVKRISVGSALYRAALGAFLRGAQEMRDHGTFSFVEGAASSRDISAVFSS
jgi:2-methylisocitrate lyase-like PEP mutase family enzyme